VVRFGQPIRVETEPGLKMEIPFIDALTWYDTMLHAMEPPTDLIILGDQKRVETRRGWRHIDFVVGPGLAVMLADTEVGSVIAAAQSGAKWVYRSLMLQFVPALAIDRGRNGWSAALRGDLCFCL
jgi:regulator of protease activity HflC (stomatin/prohibitin superfamily)